MINTDIDIDVANRDDIISSLKCIHAAMSKEGQLVRHNSGVYFQNIPRDPFTNTTTIHYEEAEQLGYAKIDILNNSLYAGVRDEEHLVELVSKEPMWELLQYEEIVEQLHHVNRYYNLLLKLKPDSIDKLAMILAIIRPAKAYLQRYSWEGIEKEVWEKGDDGYQFKKSHAYSYALSIMVQMNLIVESHSSD
jgi:hypothetical protein